MRRLVELVAEGEEMSDETFERKITTPAEREARKAFRQVETAKAMTDHERSQRPAALLHLPLPRQRRLMTAPGMLQFRPAREVASGLRSTP